MLKYFTSLNFILTAIAAVVALVAYIGLKVVRKKHMNDPEYVKRMEELRLKEEEELNRRVAEYDEELEAYPENEEEYMQEPDSADQDE